MKYTKYRHSKIWGGIDQNYTGFCKQRRQVSSGVNRTCLPFGEEGTQAPCTGQGQQVVGASTCLPGGSPGCRRLPSTADQVGHHWLAARHRQALPSAPINVSHRYRSAADRQLRQPCLRIPCSPIVLPGVEAWESLGGLLHTTQGSPFPCEQGQPQGAWLSCRGWLRMPSLAAASSSATVLTQLCESLGVEAGSAGGFTTAAECRGSANAPLFPAAEFNARKGKRWITPALTHWAPELHESSSGQTLHQPNGELIFYNTCRALAEALLGCHWVQKAYCACGVEPKGGVWPCTLLDPALPVAITFSGLWWCKNVCLSYI